MAPGRPRLPQGRRLHAGARGARATTTRCCYTTGRTVYQFHTRTKTGRARSLNEAAPDAWVELSPADADRLGISEGDWVRVESPRGADRGPRPRSGG